MMVMLKEHNMNSVMKFNNKFRLTILSGEHKIYVRQKHTYSFRVVFIVPVGDTESI